MNFTLNMHLDLFIKMNLFIFFIKNLSSVMLCKNLLPRSIHMSLIHVLGEGLTDCNIH